MNYSNKFFKALGLKFHDKKQILKFSKNVNISISKLNYYNDNNIIPSGNDLDAICKIVNITEKELMIKMGILDRELIERLVNNSDEIIKLLKQPKIPNKIKIIKPKFETKLGKLYKCDCIDLARSIDNDTIDMIFADPPFNLNKLYPSKINDNIKSEKYILWCERWLNECVRILKPGGSLFLWNLPRWNKILTQFLDTKLLFRNWICADIKYGLPIQNRLYPAHYSLLYYVKGSRPNTFHPDRLPMQICPVCFADLKDYGGYKNKMNSKGINLSDVWLDIPPVRHKKYKKRNGSNELSIKLLDRIIELSTDVDDIIFDPFGGSGTTYIVSEIKKRKWFGCEIGPITDIIKRFKNINEERDFLKTYRENLNNLFPKKILKARKKRGLWINKIDDEK